jgi:hypothetical protein
MKCRMINDHPRLGKGKDRHKTNNGYITIRVSKKQVYEHRHVMELSLGRKLLRTEHVHHVNGDKTDNRIENLITFSGSEHHRHHMLDAGKAKRMSILGHAARWSK